MHTNAGEQYGKRIRLSSTHLLTCASLHLTTVGLFREDQIGTPEGLVPTPDEEDVFRALDLEYIRECLLRPLIMNGARDCLKMRILTASARTNQRQTNAIPT